MHCMKGTEEQCCSVFNVHTIHLGPCYNEGSDMVSQEQGWTFYISNKLPGGGSVAGPWIALREAIKEAKDS